MAKRINSGLIEIALDQVELLASRGLSQKQVAYCVGVGESTWHERKKLYPEIILAYKRGASKGIKEVASALYAKALGGNVSAMIFFLRSRAPEEWGDHHEKNQNVVMPYETFLKVGMKKFELDEGPSAKAGGS